MPLWLITVSMFEKHFDYSVRFFKVFVIFFSKLITNAHLLGKSWKKYSLVISLQNFNETVVRNRILSVPVRETVDLY